VSHQKELPVKKSGPKGPWKAKGKALEMIITLNQENPRLSGEQISQMVWESMGTDLSRQRINQIRRELEGRSCP